MTLDGEPAHYCEGCRRLHLISVTKPNQYSNAQWTFNNDYEKPTFTPSINIVGHCHYFITDGNIMYCGDSTHSLAGLTVPLPNFPNWILEDEDETY